MLTVKKGVSHLDHGLNDGIVKYILHKYKDREGFFIDTFDLETEGRSGDGDSRLPIDGVMAQVDTSDITCGLHGPIVGDNPVPISECEFEVRSGRDGPSRLCDRLPRPTTIITVIAGPHDGEACVLYTAFGGPLAPKEPWDIGEISESDDQYEANLKERMDSSAFWGDHALSR